MSNIPIEKRGEHDFINKSLVLIMEKTALIVGLYPTEACPKFSIEMAKALKANGIKVYAVLPYGIENMQDWNNLLPENRICLIENNYGNSHIKRYICILKMLLLKKQILEKVKGIYFNYVFFSFYHRWNDLVLKEINFKHSILFLHDPIPHSDEKKNMSKKVFRQTKKMSKLVVLSKKFIEITKKHYKRKKSDILYMPLGLFYGTRNINSYLEFIDEKSPVSFLFFGRITKYKGIDILIEAYSRIESEKTRLIIAGNGDFSPYINKFKRLKNAFLTNRYLDDNDIEKLFKIPNCVIVLPYIDATQSGVVSLAYSFGVPVIASDTGGLKEQLDNGNIGMYFHSGDIDKLAECMRKILFSRQYYIDEVKKMIVKSKEYDWNRIVSDLLDNIMEEEN